MVSSNRHALLVGIEYLGTPNALPGCHRDVNNMRNLLQGSLNYNTPNISVVTENSGIQPTRQNILQQLDALVERCIAKSAEQAFIYFSCHGNQIVDQNGDESTTDHLDEVLVPLDYDRAGFITDDVLVTYLARFPSSCNCIAVFDSCNSGTMADLPYSFNYNPSTRTCLSSIQNNLKLNSTVVSISGSKDYQTSDLVFANNEWNSALTTALIGILKRTQENMTLYQLQSQLIDYMILHQLTQRPVVSTSWRARPGALMLTIPPPLPTPNTTSEDEIVSNYINSDPIFKMDARSYWNMAFF